ncbi:MAG: hypothetical protein ACI9YL_001053 [Luteibaculaceae bacterium]|jgi:hypothetical protein
MDLKIFSAIAVGLFLGGCAQVKAPIGGDKDVSPPELVSAKPMPGERDFLGSKVILAFDEYVELKDQSQILISPEIENGIDVKAKGKSVEVILKGEMAPNTTYQIYFGNSVVDFREGNTLENYSLAWSTGFTLDTLLLKGNLKVGSWLTPQANWLVGAFKPDTNFIDSLPVRLARTNKEGEFVLSNLRDMDYALAAWNDGNFNNRWDAQSEALAFSLEVFNPTRDTAAVALIGQKQLPQKAVLSYSLEGERSIKVKTNPFFSDVALIWSESDVFIHQEIHGDSSLLWLKPNLELDSLQAISNYGDTLSFFFTGFKKPTSLKLATNFPSTTVYGDQWNFTFSEPVYRDSIQYRFVQDSTEILGSLIFGNQQDMVSTQFPFGLMDTITKGMLHVNDSSFSSIYGSPVSKGLYSFKMMDEKDYGKFILVLDTLVEGNLEIFDGENRVFSQQVTNKKIQTPLLKAGKYKIRILGDANENGTWEGPQVNFGFAGEAIWVYPGAVQLRANWEKELIWEIIP